MINSNIEDQSFIFYLSLHNGGFMKKTCFFGILLLFCISSFAFAQGNLLSETKKLQALKLKGKITEAEFQKRKAELIKANFESPEDKRKQEEQAKTAEEAIKAQELAKEKKLREEEARTVAEYDVKFPLHAAVKAQNKDQLKAFLQSPKCEINGFDDSGKTAWDLAYEIKSATMSFDLCNLLKSAGGVSSEEIKKFAEEKTKVNSPAPSVVNNPPVWEYETVFFEDNLLFGEDRDAINSKLNSLGAQGWEVMSEKRERTALNTWGVKVSLKRIVK